MARNVFWKIDTAVADINRTLGIGSFEVVDTTDWDEESQEMIVTGSEEILTLNNITFRLRPFFDDEGSEVYYWFSCGSHEMEGHFKDYPFVLETKDY